MLVTQAEVSNLDIPLNFSGLRDAEEETCGEKEPARIQLDNKEEIMTQTEKLREELVAYFRTHSREGDCPCDTHQKQMYEWTNAVLKVCKKAGLKFVDSEHPYAPNLDEEIEL